eukprot:294738-Chlamydomonas_euryale.AAC.1
MWNGCPPEWMPARRRVLVGAADSGARTKGCAAKRSVARSSRRCRRSSAMPLRPLRGSRRLLPEVPITQPYGVLNLAAAAVVEHGIVPTLGFSL